MTMYFTSDNHFGHANVIGYCDRPFGDVAEMTEAMVSLWNDTVNASDEVMVLGDFAMGKIAETLPILERLNGRKELVVGNHDRPFPYTKATSPAAVAKQVRQSYKWHNPYIEAGFSNILYDADTVVHEWDGTRYTMSHFPYAEDDSDPRYKMACMSQDDFDVDVHLCGHIHEQWKIKKAPNGTPMINVGVDQWDFTPVSIEELFALL